MRASTCHPIHAGLAGRRAASGARYTRALAASLLALLVVGCGSVPARYTPLDESGPWGYKGTYRMETLTARSDFSMELVRFTDSRRPRSLERGPAEQTMDTYDPDNLLAGVSTRLPALYEKYLAYKPRHAKHYKVELELRELRTEVLNGNFWSGPFGRYKVKLELEATARRPDSQVVLRRGYRFEDTRPRKTFNGRSPSVSMDEARLIDLVDEAVRRTAMTFAYELRRDDARTWRPDKEAAPTPTTRVRLVRQPTLTRATGTATLGESELVMPAELATEQPAELPPVEAPRYAPDSMPTMTPLGSTRAVVPAAQKTVTW